MRDFNLRSPLTRQQLAQFLGTPELIRAFEALGLDVAEVIPTNEEEILRISRLALALSAQALMQADREPEDAPIIPGLRGESGQDGISRFVLDLAECEEQPIPRGSPAAIAVTGSRGGNAALASLLTALAAQGLILDNTST